MAEVRLAQGTLVVVGGHAVERYQERVRPALPLDAVREELLRLLGTVATIQRRRPEWLSDGAEETHAYVLIGDDIAFPVFKGALVTCVTRGAIGDEVRRQRSDARRRRSKVRASARRNRNEKIGDKGASHDLRGSTR